MDVAIIGLGMRIAGVWKHLHAAAGGRIRLIAHADPAPTGLRVLHDAGLDAGHAYTDHRVLLRERKPDAILIGSPNHLHLDHLRDALMTGCRVFTEKPVVISPEETWAAAGLIAQHGAERVQVGLVLRSSPFFRTVQAHLGALGALVSMEANEHLPPEHGGFLMRDWRRQRAWSGSHILEKCCHDIDLLQAVAGRVVRTASFGGRSIFTAANRHLEDGPSGARRYRDWWRGWNGTDDVFTSDGDILDHQVAICETERGVRFTFHLNNHAADRQRRWLLIGVEGALEGDFALPTARLRRVYEEPRQITIGDGRGDGHYGADAAMAADLAACWLDGRPFPVPAKAALEAGLACMAIDQAQRTGSIVDSREWLARLDTILP
jgi:predicted dehydrogenase